MSVFSEGGREGGGEGGREGEEGEGEEKGEGKGEGVIGNALVKISGLTGRTMHKYALIKGRTIIMNNYDSTEHAVVCVSVCSVREWCHCKLCSVERLVDSPPAERGQSPAPSLPPPSLLCNCERET